MVFGYIFQGPYVLLEAKDAEADNPDDTLPCVEQDIGRHYSYSYLLKPGYINDSAIRTELIEAWFRTSNFIVTDAALLGPSLEKYPWSAGIDPVQLIRRVYVTTKPLEAPLMREAICKELEHLTCLKPGTTITIHMDRSPETHTLWDIRKHAASLFPVSLRMRSLGYKMIIQPWYGSRIVVEPGNPYIADWAKETGRCLQST